VIGVRQVERFHRYAGLAHQLHHFLRLFDRRGLISLAVDEQDRRAGGAYNCCLIEFCMMGIYGMSDRSLVSSSRSRTGVGAKFHSWIHDRGQATYTLGVSMSPMRQDSL
jgi:hypothetical protein